MLKQVCKKCLYTFEGTGDICPECLEKKKKHQDYLGALYYVYEFIRLDTNEPFYVGKGKNNRAFRKISPDKDKRLFSFIEENKFNYAVNLLENNLSEEDAFMIESEKIQEYIFDFGYDLKNILYAGDETFLDYKRRTTEELWKDEDFREKVTTRTKEAMQDEVIRMQCSDGAKKAWEDEEYRAKITAALKRPRRSAPKTKARVQIVNVVTNEIVVDVEGMTNAKNEMSKRGFGSKKFAKLRNGEIFEDLKLIKMDKK